MDIDEQPSSTIDIIDGFKKSNLFLICKVCGTDNAQLHYGGLCCISCKMFFRRNSQFDLNLHQCVFREKCDITINSRRSCRYCRLQKCFSIGMQRELLRAPHRRPDKLILKSIETIPSLDLLRNNRSLLTDEQWCCLSNIINVYNTKSPVIEIRQLLSTQSKYPMKMRLKMSKTNIVDIITSMYQAIFPFVEVLPEFQTMQINDRYSLIERNLSCIGSFNGIIVFRDAEVTSSTAFKNGFPSVYGSNIVDDAVMVAQRTDADVTLIKLLIPVLLFSTSFNVIVPRYLNNNYQCVGTDSNSVFLNTKHLFDIQNVYLEIMFKYMIYRFGYNEASLRFAALIKSFLDQNMCTLRAGEVQTHDQLVQTVVKRTEIALTCQNEIME